MSVEETRFARLDGRLDTDWYRIALEAGQLYHVEMQQNIFTTNQSGEESRLRIEDLNGTVLAMGLPFGPDNESAGLTFRPETDGEYVAIASHESGSGAFYSLTARALSSLRSTDGDDQLSLPGDVAVQLLDIDGGAGRDAMSFAGYEGGVVLNLANGYVRGDAPGDRFALLMDGIEVASGTSQDDRLFGSDGSDALRGLGGRDRMFGSDGRDLIHGGAGRDLLSYGLSEDGVSVSLLRGRGWSGDAAGDRIRSVENLAGSHQNDFLWGDHRANVLIGGAGDDVLTGNGGDDYLFGGAGTDIAVFAGNRADYAIAQSGDYHQITGPGGDLDQVAGVEILRFADGDLLL
jgi:Ca2+-binding RTX toxin-like protein